MWFLHTTSQATRLCLSCCKQASSTLSAMRSQILSGQPSSMLQVEAREERMSIIVSIQHLSLHKAGNACAEYSIVTQIEISIERGSVGLTKHFNRTEFKNSFFTQHSEQHRLVGYSAILQYLVLENSSLSAAGCCIEWGCSAAAFTRLCMMALHEDPSCVYGTR
jgi:hypothetical protein